MKSVKKILLSYHPSLSLIIQAILVSWCLMQLLTGAIAMEPPRLSGYLDAFPLSYHVFLLILLALIISFLFHLKPYYAPVFTLTALFIYGFAAGAVHSDTTLAAAFAGIFCAAFKILIPDEWLSRISLAQNNRKLCLWIFIACTLIFFLFTGTVTAFRYLTFRTPCFDFGIFAQMFHQMKETGLPMTTCERNMPLSHFAVHLSPIYYLILPVYIIFPHPVTLQIAQAAILASGVIPLWKLCRHYTADTVVCSLLAIIYFFHPALSGGCFYDIHENAFLAPLLLWLFYCVILDKCRKLWVFIPFILILLVKEDAAIYPAFFGLWLMARSLEGNKSRFPGGAMFILSVIYFCGAILFLEQYGLGSMVNRFDNLTYLNGGFGELLTSVFLLPAHALRECLDGDKLIYLIQMLAPFALLPLCIRRGSNWILLGPLILMNLLSDYPYQHTIRFQYNFGSLSFLFLLFLENLPRNPVRRFRITLIAAASTLMLFGAANLSRVGTISDYFYNRNIHQHMDETLSIVPESASVSASTMLVAHFYDHDELYPLDAGIMTDYVVLDLRFPEDASLEIDYIKKGYICLHSDTKLIILYRQATSS